MAPPNAGAVSVVFPGQILNAAQVLPFADLISAGLAQRLWFGQSGYCDPLHVMAQLAGQGRAVPFGTAISLLGLRHPLQAALEARSAALLTGQCVVAGFGPGEPRFVESILGQPYPNPASTAADYARTVRAMLADPAAGTADFVPQARLPRADSPRVDIGLGVLRPRMARAAADVVDVAITWLAPPSYITTTIRPALSAGLRSRTTPPRVANGVAVVLTRPGRDPGLVARAALAHYLATAHYTDMWRRAGITTSQRTPEAAIADLRDAGVLLAGSPAEVADGVLAHLRAGVDEVVLNVAGVATVAGLQSALADLTEILTALRNRSVDHQPQRT